MNQRFRSFAKSFSFVMTGNLYSLLISTLVTFIIPRYFTKETYSYFQLENLYCGYIWLISIGWTDGYYIKYGGEKREDLNKSKISSLISVTSIYSIIVSIILVSVIISTNLESSKKYVFIMAAISVCIEIITNSLANMLQATNSMKQYAAITIIDRTTYTFFVLALILTKCTNFKYLILVDIISKVFLLINGIFMCRDFLFGKIIYNKELFQNVKEIISVGISVSLASYASKLINSITQFAIEQKWGLLTFGKVALTLTISNAFTKFVSAVSLVLFPTLRRTSKENQISVYNALSTLLSLLMLTLFVFFIPMKMILGFILPNYADSLQYIAILLPISLFETKVTMLINTYLKIIRHEKDILFSNVFSVALCTILVLISSMVFNNLNLTLVSIVIVLAFRCYFAEYRLSKHIDIDKFKIDIFIMAVLFIISNWVIGGFIGTGVYVLGFILYLLKNRSDILNAKNIILMVSKK